MQEITKLGMELTHKDDNKMIREKRRNQNGVGKLNSVTYQEMFYKMKVSIV